MSDSTEPKPFQCTVDGCNLGPFPHQHGFKCPDCEWDVEHDHGTNVPVDPPTHDEQPASKTLGDVDNELPTMVVADDVAYIDPDGNDVTDETIQRNMDAAVVTDNTER
jgi:hypothetical protein